MRFVNPLPFVADIERAKGFYRDLLGLAVLADHGDFVRFEGGFALHEGAALHRTVFGEAPASGVPWGRDNLVLYFEVQDLDGTFDRLAGRVDLIHPIRREPWGQRVFRLRDPDRHVVEIGEPQG